MFLLFIYLIIYMLHDFILLSPVYVCVCGRQKSTLSSNVNYILWMHVRCINKPGFSQYLRVNQSWNCGAMTFGPGHHGAPPLIDGVPNAGMNSNVSMKV